jgi:phospholipid/cholesterol/gamma-HCH transport system substrate-binding protein
LQSTDSIAKKLDQGVINDLPQIIAKLDAALIQYEKLGKNANHVLESNQEAIDNFAQQGLTQVGPALVELRSLLKQLRLVAEEIESRPNALITGKNATQEFKP